MIVRVIAVGRPGRLLQAAIAEYEERARRYWKLEVVEVKEERAARPGDDARVRSAEGERILQRVGDGMELIALTRAGKGWSSTELAKHLGTAADQGRAGVAFVIGGAFGLSPDVLQRATHRLRLSTGTLPHDLARLVLAEQMYRAGTINRGEPYHKGAE